MRTTLFTLLFLVPLVVTAADPTDTAGAPSNTRLHVSNRDDCPVEILEKKSRVVDPSSLNARGGPGTVDSTMYKKKGYGAIERHIVYDIAYRNRANQTLLAAEFVLEGYGDDDDLKFKWTRSYDAKTLSPQRIEIVHEVGLAIVEDVAYYKLSVRGALLADGTLWVPRDSDSATTGP